jgi:hypothetical protein
MIKLNATRLFSLVWQANGKLNFPQNVSLLEEIKQKSFSPKKRISERKKFASKIKFVWTGEELNLKWSRAVMVLGNKAYRERADKETWGKVCSTVDSLWCDMWEMAQCMKKILDFWWNLIKTWDVIKFRKI